MGVQKAKEERDFEVKVLLNRFFPHNFLNNKLLQKELERLRKESSTLLAKERARVNELLRQQDAEKEEIGSFKLKAKWKENGVYNKENLISLFSKVVYF